MKILLRKISLLAAWLLTIGSGNVMADLGQLGESCGNPFENGVGPYDYENSHDREFNIPIVEKYHFNRDVEYLIRGQSTVNILGDLDYVLRAVPNHSRALATVLRYAPNRTPAEEQYRETECYFKRAVIFRPKSAALHLLYGVYLANDNRLSEAEGEYSAALELNPNYAEAHYNIGLLYVRQEKFEFAIESAKKAYALGFPLPGLKRKLERAGVWDGN